MAGRNFWISLLTRSAGTDRVCSALLLLPQKASPPEESGCELHTEVQCSTHPAMLWIKSFGMLSMRVTPDHCRHCIFCDRSVTELSRLHTSLESFPIHPSRSPLSSSSSFPKLQGSYGLISVVAPLSRAAELHPRQLPSSQIPGKNSLTYRLPWCSGIPTSGGLCQWTGTTRRVGPLGPRPMQSH